MDALHKAIKLAGSQQALADRINQWLPPAEQIGQSAISEWLRRGRVPGEKVILVARAVAHAVLPHELRADLYPHPEDGLPNDRRALGLLAGFDEVLTADERNGIAAAIVKGEEHAIRAIEALDKPIAVREQLLKAANLGEGKAA